MKSLIIGGTSSLGRHISEKLIILGAEITTISRAPTGIEKFNHFQCDVRDQDNLKEILDQIRLKNPIFDNLWCVAGYAFPKKIEEQTPEVAQRHLDGNLTYVQSALETLKESLARSENPLVVTFGSQWSYRHPKDCPELTPYANAKRALRNYTLEFARTNPEITANHYCIPSSNTFAFRRIDETLRNLQGKELLTSHGKLADPESIAHILVEHALTFRESGKTLIFNSNGLVELLK